MHLYLVVLGGRIKNGHVEMHDVRWVVGLTIEDTFKQLRQQWVGSRKGLHIDSYRRISHVDGYHIQVLVDQPMLNQKRNEHTLWFVNLGAYDPLDMAERHHYGLVVANTANAAKIKAKQQWQHSLKQPHKDDCHQVTQSATIDDLFPIQGNGLWRLNLIPEQLETKPKTSPDWFGYRPI